jgi:hypothetical protein
MPGPIMAGIINIHPVNGANDIARRAHTPTLFKIGFMLFFLSGRAVHVRHMQCNNDADLTRE